jgi:predicted XRE-type DNA-binding protein
MKNLKDGEELKRIDGYPDYYISNYGRVWSDKSCRGTKGRWLKARTNRGGYYQINLLKNGKRKTERIHKLVAQHFLKNPNGYPCVLHNDGDPYNNHVENLRFGSAKMNHDDAVRHGTRGFGEKSPNPKLTADAVREIKILLCDSDLTQREIGEKFGVSKGTISKIKNRKLWKHI